jgi:hypothetical protein
MEHSFSLTDERQQAPDLAAAQREAHLHSGFAFLNLATPDTTTRVHYLDLRAD